MTATLKPAYRTPYTHIETRSTGGGHFDLHIVLGDKFLPTINDATGRKLFEALREIYEPTGEAK